MAALEGENRQLRELVEGQAGHLEELEQQGRQPGNAETFGVAGQDSEWRPSRRGRGMSDAGVVTLEPQPDEDHAFGPAPPPVAEWRGLRSSGDQAASRIDRAKDRVRRWELEMELLRDCQLTLPPETHPLDELRKADHIRRRQDALVEALLKLKNAKRTQLLRRVVTLGLWWQ